MKAVLSVILSAASLVMGGAVLDKRTDCHADNCARQVTGTGGHLLPITERQADCSSFQITTVFPEPTTATVTVTVYEETDLRRRNNANMQRREASTETPSDIPVYASSCVPENLEYGSACSCWGITATATTMPQETVVVTTTELLDYCEW